jgi:hypothetical protein
MCPKTAPVVFSVGAFARADKPPLAPERRIANRQLLTANE